MTRMEGGWVLAGASVLSAFPHAGSGGSGLTTVLTL